MKLWLWIAAVLALIWMSLKGFTVPNLVAGLAFGLGVMLLTREVYLHDVSPEEFFTFVAWLGPYLAVFVYQVLKSNLYLAYLVLHPSMPIEPSIIDVPLRVGNELGVTLIANSITMTPGTLTLDYEEESHSLQVHTLFGSTEDVQEDIGLLQGIAVRMGV